MNLRSGVINFLFFLFCVIHESHCGGDLTVQIKSGAVDCFYEDFKKESEIELDYQVIDGGDMDIKVTLHSPNGDVLFAKESGSEGSQKIKAVMDGTHVLCLDNTQSSFFDKMVFFDWDVSKDNRKDHDFNSLKFAEEAAENLGAGLKDQLGTLKNHLDNAVHLQNLLRTFEARDRAQVEKNFTYVNWFSGIQLFVMMSVGLVQVIMIRGLFSSPNSKGTKMRT